MKTIKIPTWLAENPELSWNAKAIYSVYYFFTFCAEYHCCVLTNDEIGLRLGLKERTIQREKQKLRDAGYIKVAGIKVYALITEEIATTDRGDTNGSRGDKSCTHNREGNKEKNKDSYTYTKGTNKEDDNKCSSSCLEGAPFLPDTPSDLDERELKYQKKLEELRKALKQYIPEGWLRGDVISWARRMGMEDSPIREILVRCYDWDVIPLQPLLKYHGEHPQDEVSMAICQVLKDRDLEEYTQFCTLIEEEQQYQTNNQAAPPATTPVDNEQSIN